MFRGASWNIKNAYLSQKTSDLAPAFVTSCTSNQPSTLDSIPSAYGGVLLVSNINITQLLQNTSSICASSGFQKDVSAWVIVAFVAHRPNNVGL